MSDVSHSPKTVKFGDPAFRADPYPTYAWLRKNAPIIQVKAPFGFGKALHGHALRGRAGDLQGPALFHRHAPARQRRCRRRPQPFYAALDAHSRNQMVTQDDPNHARLKNLVHKALPRPALPRSTPASRSSPKTFWTRRKSATPIDIVEDFALPLPMTVISEMLGVPQDRRKPFRDLMANMLDAPASALLRAFKQVNTTRRLIAFLHDLINLRRAEPDDGIDHGPDRRRTIRRQAGSGGN